MGALWATNFPPIIEFMDMDTDHVVFRKFKRLHLYSLLFQQRRLANIDEDISKMKFTKGVDATSNYTRLAEILPTLEFRLKKYDEALLRQDLLMKMGNTPKRLVEEYKTMKCSEFRDEIKKGDGWNDLVSLGCTQKYWMHRFIDRNKHLQRLFETARSREEKLEFHLYSENKVRMAEKIIINLAFCIMVMVPLFILSYLTNVTIKLLVITTAFFITSVIASVLSNNIENASLAVIAGYTAILVVFLSNNPSR
ncbi:uncharacterized protein Z518_07910 [Rhinocladiella mackenziei CBS 650.93]|uniref:DUF6594 domain-containing protein n=1 Tax=Rhinocladiella mackenziei CBS 650.93 TaxID=1442369 RepID=A0A0D2IFC3_9EURO|nr:uncharacterized protein Z518_07910 [Rhinocladiella mackenziei CBS 650.93]KIX01971.1 hypothetical protein Z518_07910 [Rhinocladiella mackenziei CBS 650.93]